LPFLYAPFISPLDVTLQALEGHIATESTLEWPYSVIFTTRQQGNANNLQNPKGAQHIPGPSSIIVIVVITSAVIVEDYFTNPIPL
jgi:hypothetical protein